MLSGVKCAICGKALEAPNYLKDADGDGIYWADPRVCEYTEVAVHFCSVEHSAEWFAKQRGVVAHDNDPEQSQPAP